MTLARSIICAGVAAALVATAARGALAGDDGGGRSVFALGAGNRALGLGGAYAGVADDASAALWNPAGLALVRRAGLQASQGSYYGLGIDEQYASLVLPSWRYGVTSVTLRHFGVGGIERRDDRNVLLEENLSSDDTEFSVGYGRTVGPAWSLGGVVKLRRQNIAGYTGGAVGVDVGVIGQPLFVFHPNTPAARRLTVGASIRNAVEPRITLVDEAVPDPTAVRLGTAYLFPVGKDQNVLAVIDVERTRRMDTRFHAGVEIAVHPLLKLRLGTSDGALTAGSGVAWNSVTLDYAYEDNPLGGIHRVGVDVAFGASVDERRHAAVQAREDELQARLAAAFQRRQSERVDELLAQSDAAMREGRHEDALATLGVVVALEPGHAGSLARQSLCLIEIARVHETDGDYAAATVSYSRALSIAPDDERARSGLDRCRAERDRLSERTQEIRRRFEAALDAFSRNDLATARLGFESIIEAAPRDEEAATMLRRTLDAIGLRVADTLAEANRLVEWGHLDEAASKIADARRLDPDARALAAAEEALGAARRRSSARPPAPAASAAPAVPGGAHAVTETDRRELERLYESGVEAMQQERSQDAIRYFELVWSVDPLYQRVSEHLKREYLVRGMEFFAAGKLEKAVEYWENARRIDPDDQRVIGYLSRAREQVARTRQILGTDE